MPVPGMLPSYQRYVNGVPVSVGRKSLRMREKYIILLVFLTFGMVCFGAFFFLPDLRDRVTVSEMRRHIQMGGAEIFVPGKESPGGLQVDNHGDIIDVHKVQDKGRLGVKIAEDVARQKAIDELSNKLKLPKDDTLKVKDAIDQDKEKLKEQEKVKEMEIQVERQREAKDKVHREHSGGEGTRGGEPADPAVKVKRDKVKEMMKHAWDSYKKYAWGSNELRPISKQGHSASIFGTSTLGATIIDALDTLYIMEMDEEFKIGRDWVATDFTFEGSTELSVFETNIRFVGGLLSAYALSGDKTRPLSGLLSKGRRLPILQALQSLYEGVTECVPVAETDRVQQGINCLEVPCPTPIIYRVILTTSKLNCINIGKFRNKMLYKIFPSRVLV